MENAQTIFTPVQPQEPIIQNTAPNPSPVFTQMPQTPPPAEKKPSQIKKILKIILILLLILGFFAAILLAIFSLQGNSALQSGQVKLTYWGIQEDNTVMQSIISDFEKENPKIQVEYVKQDLTSYRERLKTRITDGNGPDIFRFNNTWYPMLSDILLPLPNSVISKDEFARNYYPVIQNDMAKNGAIYGIPLEIDTLSLFINTQLLQSAGLSRPVTWNDFINAARLMTVKDTNGKIKTAGAAMGTYDNVTHAPDILSLLFLQNGVDFNNIVNSSDRVQGALNFYTNFATDQNNVWDNTLDPSILAFSKGNLGMFFGYSWDYFTIKQFNPGLNFQIVSVPQLPNQNRTLANYWAEGVSSKSKNQKEALLFMKYLIRKDVVQKLYALEAKERGYGEPYARIDLADSLKNTPDFYTFVSQAPDASSSYFTDTTNDTGLSQELNTYLKNAINSILKSGSFDSSFNDFSAGVTQVYQKYNL